MDNDTSKNYTFVPKISNLQYGTKKEKENIFKLNTKDLKDKNKFINKFKQSIFNIKKKFSFISDYLDKMDKQNQLDDEYIMNETYVLRTFDSINLSLRNSNIKQMMIIFPLQYKDEKIEKLYVYYLNQWISSKIIKMTLIMITITIVVWTILALALRQIRAWDQSILQIFYHLFMLFNIILFIVLMLVSIHHKKLAEFSTYLIVSFIMFLCALWKFVFINTFSHEIIKQTTLQKFSTYLTIYMLIFVYEHLPLIIVDSYYCTRTKYNWALHAFFILLNCFNIIITIYLYNTVIPHVYMFYKLIGLSFTTSFFFCLCYATEIQTRCIFYNLLLANYKIDKLENQIDKTKNEENYFNDILDNSLMLIKKCHEITVELNNIDINVIDYNRLYEIQTILEKCIAILKKPKNDIKDEYLEKHNFIEFYSVNQKSQLFVEDEYINSNLSNSFSDKYMNCHVQLDRKKLQKFFKLVDDNNIINEIKILEKKIIDDWDFNCLEYFSNSKYPFFDINYTIFKTISNNNIPINLIINFLSFVENQYNSVPYHNSVHATMVTQKIFSLINNLNIYEKIDYKIKLVTFISSICHDIGHPGFNNLYFSNTLHPISIIYNDISILENYHASITFNILKLKQCNILGSFSQKDFRIMRLYIIELILATDLQQHFDNITEFRQRINNQKFDYLNNTDDLLSLSKILIKTADVSHGAVKWKEHYLWCKRVLSEFYEQGDTELKKKLPISPLCDRSKHDDVAKSQIAFLKYVLRPLFVELKHIDKKKFIKNVCMKRLNQNCEMWEIFVKKKKTVSVHDSANNDVYEKKIKYNYNKHKNYIDLSLLFGKCYSD